MAYIQTQEHTDTENGKQLADLQNEIQQRNDTIAQLQHEIGMANAQLTAQSSDESCDEKIRKLQTAWKQAQDKQMDEIQKSLSEARQHANTLQASVHVLTGQLQNAARAHEEEVRALQTARDVLTEHEKKLRSELKAANEARAKVEANVAETKNAYNTVDTERQQLKQQLTYARAEVDEIYAQALRVQTDASSATTALESQLQEAATANATLQHRLQQSAQEMNQELQGQLQELQTRLETEYQQALQRATESHDTAMKAVQRELAALQGSLSEREKALTGEVARLVAANEAQGSELNKAMRSIQDLQGQIEQTRIENQGAQEEAQSALTACRRSIAELNDETEAQQHLIRQQNTALEETNAELQRLRQENDTLPTTRSEIERLEATNTGLNERITELTTLKDNANNLSIHMKNENEKLRQELSELHDTENTLTEQLERKEN
eukprot:3360876-Rhodomonas_salina.1